MARSGRYIRWSLVEEGSRPTYVREPHWNMALDAANLDAVLNGSDCRVRLYQWSDAAITLGRFQDATRALVPGRCCELGLSVARRPTGGRGILHGGDLTFSLAVRLVDVGLPETGSVGAIYDHLSVVLVTAFSRLGIEAARGDCCRGSAERSSDCMAAVTRADVVDRATGAKLVGAALLRRGAAILLQCTIPVNTADSGDPVCAGSVFVSNGAEALAPSPSRLVAADDLRSALLDALTAHLGRGPSQHSLSVTEAAVVAVLAGDHIVQV